MSRQYCKKKQRKNKRSVFFNFKIQNASASFCALRFKRLAKKVEDRPSRPDVISSTYNTISSALVCSLIERESEPTGPLLSPYPPLYPRIPRESLRNLHHPIYVV